jgi:hypothetical protein
MTESSPVDLLVEGLCLLRDLCFTLSSLHMDAEFCTC